ncbi:hypothetical protein Barb6XT_00478 [Bacteroidales bacterium Barb6XT]|nr:hypothetical protein Barb6XT_00478 [Bacteroidales bacterium Barb6XT]
MRFYIVAPNALLSCKCIVNMLYNFCQKCSRASGRVKNLYFVDFSFIPLLVHCFYFGFTCICQSLRQIKLGFQNVINGTHDKINHRCRRIPDTASLTQFRVVFTQERFIKMDNRGFRLRLFSITFQYFSHIASQENISQTIYHPFDTVVNIGACNISEQFSQKRIGFGNEFCRFLAAESIRRRVVQSGGKHAVGYGLSINICKSFGGNIVNKYFFECFFLFSQRTVFIFIFITC